MASLGILKIFWARPESEFSENFAIYASNNIWKKLIVWMIFGSKLQSRF